MTERDRLQFVIDRDGVEAAKKFAEQTLAVYVKASVERGPYKESIEECVKFLEEDGEYEVKFVVVRSST